MESNSERRINDAERRFKQAQARISQSGGMTMKGGGTSWENEYASSALILMQAGKLPKIRAKYRYSG